MVEAVPCGLLNGELEFAGLTPPAGLVARPGEDRIKGCPTGGCQAKGCRRVRKWQ